MPALAARVRDPVGVERQQVAELQPHLLLLVFHRWIDAEDQPGTVEALNAFTPPPPEKRRQVAGVRVAQPAAARVEQRVEERHEAFRWGVLAEEAVQPRQQLR